MAALGVIADDLTGALDTGVQFSKRGLYTLVLLGEGLPDQGDVLVIDTESRADWPKEAYQKVRQAAQRLREATYLYKKIDSTLRGNIGWELEAVMDELGIERAIVAPAFPANGRTTVRGRQLVNGLPLEQTPFALDPISPVSESHLPTLLRKQVRRPVGSITLEVVAQGTEALAAAILRRPEAILVIDALTSDHLRIIAQAAVLAGAAKLTCGSAGLAQELPAALELEPYESMPFPAKPSYKPVLVVAGSRHEATARQIRYAIEALNLPLVEPDINRLLGEGERRSEIRRVVREAANVLRQGKDPIVASTFSPLMPGSGRAIAAWLGEITKRVLDREEVSGLVLTGGDTAIYTCQAIEAIAIRVEGEVQPGIPAARLLGGRHEGLRIVTKAGGFGDEDAIAAAIRYLREGVGYG